VAQTVLPDTKQTVTINMTEEDKPVQTPERNLFIQYKAFPSLERLKTKVIYNEKNPKFGHKSQFPIMMVPDTLEKLENFCFVLEVWDQICPT
jgi:hypothetical protein